LQKIILTELDKRTLAAHSENQKPNEACAILFGKDNLVSELFLTENIDASPVNFTISNDQLIEAYKIAEEKHLAVIGIFHSHPNSDAFPSSTDMKFMQSNPVAWVIYSGVGKNFRAFVLESEITEVFIDEK